MLLAKACHFFLFVYLETAAVRIVSSWPRRLGRQRTRSSAIKERGAGKAAQAAHALIARFPAEQLRGMRNEGPDAPCGRAAATPGCWDNGFVTR